MGGLYNRKISGRSSNNRTTSRLIIPRGAAAGLAYMQTHNLLSRNPLGSGGVGRMFRLQAGGCCLENHLGSVKKTTESLGDSLGEVRNPPGSSCGGMADLGGCMYGSCTWYDRATPGSSGFCPDPNWFYCVSKTEKGNICPPSTAPGPTNAYARCQEGTQSQCLSGEICSNQSWDPQPGFRGPPPPDDCDANSKPSGWVYNSTADSCSYSRPGVGTSCTKCLTDHGGATGCFGPPPPPSSLSYG